MDGALHTADTLRAYTERAISRIGGRDDRARRAELREGLFHPCTWAVFMALGPAGQAGALAALAFCQDEEGVADAVQAAALLELDPVRQAAAAKDARGKGLAFEIAAPETHARCARSRARRNHTARARGGGDPSDQVDGDPLALLLCAEAELDDDDGSSAAVQAAAALLTAQPPRPRGRPTRGEILECAGQQQLPGLPPGGSTTRSSSGTTRAALPPPAPAQLDLWGRP